MGKVSSESRRASTEASSSGYGSGASDTEEYSCRNAEDVVFPWLVSRSINVWYAVDDQYIVNTTGACAQPLSKPLNSVSLEASSSFLKSFVFCAKSFRETNASLWFVTMSEAVLSSSGTSLVRSMSRWG